MVRRGVRSRLCVQEDAATWDGVKLTLTRTEHRLLRVLCDADGPMTRQDIALQVFGDRTGLQRVDVHVCHLRAKLTATDLCIRAGQRGTNTYALDSVTVYALIAEDHPAASLSVRNLLVRSFGAEVEVVATEVDALAALAAHPWDVVVADVLLPRDATSGVSAPGGLAVVERAIAARVAPTAIVISGEPAFAVHAYRLKVPFLLKPFTGQTLCAVVRDRLRLRANSSMMEAEASNGDGGDDSRS
jgi:DNA-binding response OmpR family regulator